MTSEIAVVNANGIALAADSAATIHGTKVYNSANKLFTLSKFEPVAIMIYGDSTLVGVPWEILIKEFRSHLHRESYDTLEKYAEKFWEYIHSRTDIFTRDIQLPYIEERLKSFLDELEEHVIQPTTRDLLKDELTESEVKNNVHERFINHIQTRLNKLRELKILDEFKNISADEIVGSYEELFGNALDQIKIIRDLLSEEHWDSLFKVIAELFRRDNFYITSGVVVAGYGRSEIYPKMFHYQVGIFVKDALQRRLTSTNADRPFQPDIYPFAQDEMVISFVFGISRMNEEKLANKFKEIAINWPQDISSILASSGAGINQAATADIGRFLADKRNEMFDTLDSCIRDSLNPIIEMLGHLEKGELAEMAESLVNLTAFKRKMSSETESVGGPIDVAVISKGDGFIWVKRKHYFKPDLNQSFFNNYFDRRGVKDEQAS